MTLHLNVLFVIIASAVVTIIPRILPFVLVRKITLPSYIIKWLSFIPVSILTALTVGSFVTKGKSFITMDWNVLTVIIPTLLVAIWTKKLSITVIVGIILMAALRLFDHLVTGA